MRSATLFVLAGLLAVVLAEGQYYVPRAYFTIDAAGHESLPVPLRRLKRSIGYYPGPATGADANANAEANANAWGGNANAKAVANANARAGYQQPYPGLAPPSYGSYGAANPLSYGMTARQAGPVVLGAAAPRSVSASSSVGLDSSGYGYYDQQTSVGS